MISIGKIVGAVVTVIVVIVAIVMLSSTVSTGSDEVLVHKGGGIVEAATAKGCVTPATRELKKPGDSYYSYPANQRDYNFTNSESRDGDPFTVVSKDNQTLVIYGTLFFTLNQDCKTLQEFHDKIGNRKSAYFTEGMDKTPAGWLNVLNTYMRPALDSTLDRVAKQYTWTQLYSDPSIKDELNNAVNAQVKSLINQQFEGNAEYFTNYSAQILQPQAPQELVDLAKSQEISARTAANVEAKAKADAAAAKAAADAQVAQKDAELKVAKIQADIEAQKMAPYGSIREYNNFLAIEKGLNPYQPSYGGGVLVNPSK